MSERYAVISSDCHGGAQLLEYKPYLPASLHDQFDAWAETYAVPFDTHRPAVVRFADPGHPVVHQCVDAAEPAHE